MTSLPDDDPWRRLDTGAPLSEYGPGARLDFSRYLEGSSAVAVASIAEIQDWLLGCTYATDQRLFCETDFWQHPVTFERLRAGDCEDFALWAWRKMLELGMDADFVAGYVLRNGVLAARHAWILFRRDGVEYLFEPAFRTREVMIHPLADVCMKYLPQVGADRTGKRFTFGGFLSGQERARAEKRRQGE